MSAASNYTETNIVNALLRGTTFPVPTKQYISLHTSNPGESGGNEVSTTVWPAYTRQDAAMGGEVEEGWTEPDDGASTNAKQILYPSNNGAGPVTVTHWALYDAATGGNLLVYAPLTTTRTLEVGDVFVFDVGSLTIQAA
jgi:hypothetical protein